MDQLKTWWENISPREQLLTMISAVVMLIAILYWGIWTPLTDQLNSSKAQLIRAEKTLTWTQEKATILLQADTVKPPLTGRNLTQILNRSARQDNITFSRIVNKKDQIEVWITEVEFDLFVQWLANLSNQHGIKVLNADVAKTERAGYIKVNRLLLGND